jgi:hypothetical protein
LASIPAQGGQSCMGIATAQDSHPRFAKIVAGIWPVFSIVSMKRCKES